MTPGTGMDHRSITCGVAWPAALCIALAACSKPAPSPPVQVAAAPVHMVCQGATEPELAVRNVLDALRTDALDDIPCLATPRTLQMRLELAWREDRSRWPLTELPLSGKLPAILVALQKPGAQASLTGRFDRQLAGQTNDLHDTARGLGLFAARYLQHEGDYTAGERAHYAALVVALADWAEHAPLGDRANGHRAINLLVAGAARTGLANDAGIREAGMGGTLRALSPLVKAAKQGVALYGLSIDDVLATATVTRLMAQADPDADHATVHVAYRVAGEDIATDIPVERRDGLWYSSGLLAAAERAANAPKTTTVLRKGLPEKQ